MTMPIEATEQTGPIIVWRKELRPDSGGDGEFRGGLGQVIEVGVTNLNDPLLYAGAGLTAVLALSADWLVALIGELLTPVGARS